MKKNLTFLLMLCLSMYACEQASLTPELTELQNHELIERGGRCDLTQIPLYIPAPESVQGQAIDFDNKFPITKSTEYEAANNATIVIEHLAYTVNGSPTEDLSYEYNDDYELSIHVTYTINGISQQETFSLCFRVEEQRL